MIIIHPHFYVIVPISIYKEAQMWLLIGIKKVSGVTVVFLDANEVEVGRLAGVKPHFNVKVGLVDELGACISVVRILACVLDSTAYYSCSALVVVKVKTGPYVSVSNGV
jgi:hypothetical protein